MHPPLLPSIADDIAAMPRSGIREIMDAFWQTPGAIPLMTGEPNFPTPPHVVDAAARAARDGKTGYVQNSGIPELRDALAEKIRTRNHYHAKAENIIVGAGGVQVLQATFAALLAPGDGILLPDPGWPNFRMMAAMQRARVQPYVLTAENDWLPTAELLDRAADASTRVLLLNSPSNPLGSVIGRARMAEIVELAERRGWWIVSDECYDEITFNDAFCSAAEFADLERTISIYTFSKSYAMTGWRVGYAVARESAALQIAKLQEPLISCVNVPAQYAALAALQGPHEVVETMVAAYRGRRDSVCAQFAAAGIPVLVPDGAFYVWADVRAQPLPSREYALHLLREHGVAVAPGSAFGAAGEGYMRISLATEPSLLREGVDRICAASTRVERLNAR